MRSRELFTNRTKLESQLNDRTDSFDVETSFVRRRTYANDTNQKQETKARNRSDTSANSSNNETPESQATEPAYRININPGNCQDHSPNASSQHGRNKHGTTVSNCHQRELQPTSFSYLR
ncbi:hypothetical protein K0M31_017839 [Melipona bicolor]|uniref:Uncharacterized protein n=1 Tax=Melipona bicolor TaxID=60889 RepID=A0AA40G6E8_9HYME|nr:hypothetical protein K0M31_017839 [Melipona bicolor]